MGGTSERGLGGGDHVTALLRDWGRHELLGVQLQEDHVGYIVYGKALHPALPRGRFEVASFGAKSGTLALPLRGKAIADCRNLSVHSDECALLDVSRAWSSTARSKS